mmetsp:Transcript_10427/g.20614  ORF Transcript_10427/g.20614 Transcript_10427/m.20614 type:complete len:791 (+) Transcript_10427:141-2513(+)|eukprot:CAMPEP_0118804622 /NCGR_PEP_ID=MMETSP1161-20130426/23555_1 /TAXON_ID=249345 /ORGANISM="Picochlorum oklahomensis, Strain CCMP2329" /LENGTH=790 /DNA_ID=CAMNT_0006733403 /DNA_START=103 /DNA_END=2475 /DNA_ORIENTATION=+
MNGKSSDWDSLLLRSEELVKQDVDVPRVERDIYQIEQFSEHLRSRVAQGDPTAKYLDASRLLAQEGLNPREYTLALQNFQIMPVSEDVQQQRGADVDSYVQQVHQSVSAAAIQMAHENAISSFEKHIDSYLDSTWQKQKKALFHAGDQFGAPVPALSKRDASNFVLRGKAAKYADVVKALNAAIANGTKIDAVSMFTDACKVSSQSSKDSAGTTLLRLWTICQRMLAGVSDIPASAVSQKQMLMIDGVKSYLEDNFCAHMQSVVQHHRTVATLGGHPDKSRLVEAYLRVKEKNRGPLDFDSPGGVDTVWARIYFCLRAGYTKEAKDIIALKVKHDYSSSAGEWIEEWIDGGCKPLTGEMAATALAESEKLLASSHGEGELRQSYMAAVCALAAGSARCADCLSRDFHSFFSTIEDYTWFRLSLIRVDGSKRIGSIGSSRLELYTLADFQSQINQYSAAHYSKGGQEPLLYAAVLLMSLQADKAIEYLATNKSTHEFRIDSVHFAICMWYHRVLDGLETSVSASSVHQYAYSLIHQDVSLALEYYIIASLVMGGSLEVKGRLLKELLTESHAYGVLLGSGGAVSEGGALAVFFPDRQHRLEVLQSVAQECASAAQFEEAVELYMVAERPAHALRILNHRIAEAIEMTSTEYAGDDTVLELCSRAEAAEEAIYTKDEFSGREKEAFEQLKIIYKIIKNWRSGNHHEVLEHLWELGFIPSDRYRVQACVHHLKGSHPAVVGMIQSILLAGGEALMKLEKPDLLHILVSFAAAIPDRISQQAYQRLSEYQTFLA